MIALIFAWTWKDFGAYTWRVKRPNILTWFNFPKGYRGPSLKISSCAEKHQSRCLLFPDWKHTLVSSNQHGVLTAWLWKSFQNATNASWSRSVRTANERLTNGYPLGTFSRERSQFCFSFHGVNTTCLLAYFNFLSSIHQEHCRKRKLISQT